MAKVVTPEALEEAKKLGAARERTKAELQRAPGEFANAEIDPAEYGRRVDAYIAAEDALIAWRDQYMDRLGHTPGPWPRGVD